LRSLVRHGALGKLIARFWKLINRLRERPGAQASPGEAGPPGYDLEALPERPAPVVLFHTRDYARPEFFRASKRVKSRCGTASWRPGPEERGSPRHEVFARKWLRKAEAIAQLQPQEGSAFHAYRRGWATARKYLPLPDVAAASGWNGTRALQQRCLHADDQTMLTVVLSGGSSERSELRAPAR
jgi:hypothetical protein